MATPSRSFKRLILALQPGVASADVRFATEMARLLQLDLLALMLDDLGLAGGARLPFTREFRGPIAGWHPTDPVQIRRDLELAVQNLRRSIEAAAQELEAKAQFEVMSGPLADTIRTISRAGDILLLAEPANPAERASAQFNWLTEAVLSSQAAVLLVPSHVRRRVGPVVAIAATDDDPSIHAAAGIATACGEELVIVDADHFEHGAVGRDLVDDGRLRVKRMSAARGAFPDPTLLNGAFRQLQERLIVMTRGAFDDTVAPAIASARRVPVLLVEAEEQTSATAPPSAATVER